MKNVIISQSSIQSSKLPCSKRSSMTALSILLMILAGCASLPDPVIEYRPLRWGQISARTEPAKVSKESATSLIKSGHARIGDVRSKVPVKRCYGYSKTDCQPVSGATAATALILAKAAAQGGDLVVIIKKASESEVRSNNKQANLRYTQQFYRGPGEQSWLDAEDTIETIHYDLSEGSVWRYDPALVKKMSSEDELFVAAKKGNLRAVKEGLAQGVNPNFYGRDQDGRLIDTFISAAVQGGHVEVVEALLAAGADVDRKNENGDPALTVAVKECHGDVVKILLAKGADVNSKSTYGNTALISAADKGYMEAVKALLARGADANAKNTDSKTALLGAAYNGHAEVVKTLLAHGADVNAKDKEGRSALWYAAAGRHLEVVKALLANGAIANMTRRDWDRQKHAEVIEFLKKAGAKE